MSHCHGWPCSQFWTFKGIFLNNFKDFLEALPLKNTLKCSQLISSSDNQKCQAGFRPLSYLCNKILFLSFEEKISQGGATFSLHFQRSARLRGKSQHKSQLCSHTTKTPPTRKSISSNSYQEAHMVNPNSKIQQP